jgi:hypothetical protein
MIPLLLVLDQAATPSAGFPKTPSIIERHSPDEVHDGGESGGAARNNLLPKCPEQTPSNFARPRRLVSNLSSVLEILAHWNAHLQRLCSGYSERNGTRRRRASLSRRVIRGVHESAGCPSAFMGALCELQRRARHPPRLGRDGRCAAAGPATPLPVAQGWLRGFRTSLITTDIDCYQTCPRPPTA